MSPANEPRGAAPGTQLARWLEAALARRARLLADPQTDVCRVFDSAGDGIDGLVIEKLGKVLIAQWHAGRLGLGEEAVRSLCELAARQLDARAVYRKIFPKDRAVGGGDLERLHRDPIPWVGAAVESELPVCENGLRFLVRPYDGYATGLFLDHRPHRTRVRELGAGRGVLNAFAYTCGFTVAAGVGGAASTVSVDVSKKYLEWGKRNLVANGLVLDRHRFICSDIFDYYRRAVRQGHRFDLIILDPPTFARLWKPRRVFALAEDLERLVAGALDLLESGGYLHVSINHRGTSQRQLEEVVTRTVRARRRRCEALERPPPPEDFPDTRQHVRSVLARVH